MTRHEPLYGKRQADCLQWREAVGQSDDVRFKLLVRHAGTCRRLVDIGCGWGQFLGMAREHVEESWGVDESADRIRDVRQTCPSARTVVCRADRLALSSVSFDVVVTSQMLHEVKLFGQGDELARTLAEIRRVLVDGGRYLLLDHADAGDGEVVVDLPESQMAKLGEFEDKFRFYNACHDVTDEGHVRISRRCLQDFLTKDHWLGTHMEAMEMDETHNVFTQAETRDLIAAAGMRVREWIAFEDIRDDLARHDGALVEGEPWTRKFLLVAERP